MHTNHLFDLITLCEKSQLDYFQYSENGEEIIFCKNNSEKQSKFTSVIVQNKKQELLFEDTKETKKNISDLQKKI